jgi:hypothetical protein
MTINQHYKILAILKQAVGSEEKAKEFTSAIQEVIDDQFVEAAKVLATKEDLNKLSGKGFTAYVSLVILLAGLYGTMIFFFFNYFKR